MIKHMFTDDDRGASTVLSYIFTIAISSILIIGLISATATYTRNQQSVAAENGLEVIGHQTVRDIEAVEQMVAGRNVVDPETATVISDQPREIADKNYDMEIQDLGGNQYVLILSTQLEPSVEVRVLFRSTVDVAETTLTGGETRIAYDDSSNEVVLTDAT